MMIERLYEKYRSEAEHIPGFEPMTPEEFECVVSDELSELQILAVEDKGEQGFLYYSICQDGVQNCSCHVPCFGYYAYSERMMVKLFQQLAMQIPADTCCDFSIRLYAHDEECIRALHMLQFGTMAEKGVRRLESAFPPIQTDAQIRQMTKPQIIVQWDMIWTMTGQILQHLQQSPVFYPCSEFTQDVYREFFLDEATELLIAWKDDKPVGMIEWNRQQDRMLCGSHISANVGEAYVIPEYQGSGVAVALLAAAAGLAQTAGAEYLWVEHGTANPNARGFWNRHFHTWQYELVRTVKTPAVH